MAGRLQVLEHGVARRAVVLIDQVARLHATAEMRTLRPAPRGTVRGSTRDGREPEDQLALLERGRVDAAVLEQLLALGEDEGPCPPPWP